MKGLPLLAAIGALGALVLTTRSTPASTSSEGYASPTLDGAFVDQTGPDRVFTQMRILVCDYPVMEGFYRDVLGLPVRFVGQEYIEFEASGGATIGLYSKALMPDAVNDCGSSSRARADDAALILRVRHLDQVASTLAERGARLVVEPRDREAWGLRTAHFRDPEGNLIELIERMDCRESPADTTASSSSDETPPPNCL